MKLDGAKGMVNMRLAYTELMPQQQLGFFGSQLTGLGGGAAYPTTYSFSPGGGGPSPLMQVLGLGGNLLGGAMGLGSLFNTGNTSGGVPGVTL